MDAEPEQDSAGRRSPRRRWDPSYAAVAITLIGGIVYTFFRLAYASFYATFHVTPEEVGLNYSQTIVRGVIPSVSIVAIVLLIATLAIIAVVSVFGYILMGINLVRLTRVRQTKLRELRAQLANDSRDTPTLDECREIAGAFWLHTREHYPGTARIMANTYGWSDEDAIADFSRGVAARFASEPSKRSSRLSVSALYGALGREVWRICWSILRHRATLLILLIATLVGLALLINHQADRVSQGHALRPSLTILTGLRAEQATVMPIETGTQAPTSVPTGPVIYLGESNGIAVILVPEGRGTVVRVPLTHVLIQSPLQ
jgi:hypothetical protein